MVRDSYSKFPQYKVIIHYYYLQSWIENTYYLHPNQNIPKSEFERSKTEIKYYQWVSFILLVQALLFYLPRIFWKTFSVKAGLNICDLVCFIEHS